MNALRRLTILSLAALLALAGCAMRPAGEDAERRRAADAGRPFNDRIILPLLSENPAPVEYLHYAFIRNAGLHTRYWEWRAAIERIPQDSSFPNVAVPFSTMFSGGKQPFWDRTTLGVSNDPMSDIPFPTKLSAAGREALEQARAAGLRFEAAKFMLQTQVLSAWDDLALLAETIRIREADIGLMRLTAQLAAVRAQTAGGQPDLLKAQTALDLAANDLSNLQAQVAPAAAKLNALLGRPPTVPVPLPESLPPLRPLPATDSDLIRLASERNPELQAFARDVAGKEQALALAKQAYIPDFGLSLSVTGSVAQTLGGMLVLPTRLEAIRAGIEEARANLKAAAAARAQYERDLAAGFVVNLYALRNDDRQIKLFQETLVPRARQMIELAQTSYSTGSLPISDLVAAERELLNARLVTAQLLVERDKALLAIESDTAVDAEAMK